MVLAAAIFGFIGSLHCVGMCGPIALLVNGRGKIHFLINRLLYHAGRTVTYMLMGLLVGLLGKLFSWGGIQQFVSIAVGLLILIALLIPSIQVSLFPSLSKVVGRLKTWFSKYIRSTKRSSSFLLGVLNGFLPCGLVYAALALALIQTSFLDSVWVMFFFGLGTMPALLLLVYSAQAIYRVFPFVIKKTQIALLVVTAVIMIWRGIAIESGLDPFTGNVTTTCQSD